MVALRAVRVLPLARIEVAEIVAAFVRALEVVAVRIAGGHGAEVVTGTLGRVDALIHAGVLVVGVDLQLAVAVAILGVERVVGQDVRRALLVLVDHAEIDVELHAPAPHRTHAIGAVVEVV